MPMEITLGAKVNATADEEGTEPLLALPIVLVESLDLVVVKVECVLGARRYADGFIPVVLRHIQDVSAYLMDKGVGILSLASKQMRILRYEGYHVEIPYDWRVIAGVGMRVHEKLVTMDALPVIVKTYEGWPAKAVTLVLHISCIAEQFLYLYAVEIVAEGLVFVGFFHNWRV